ncbi:MAG: hypothetical protein IJ497_12370 [Clostridia bacterium]|nr:hypothetical protein [Clostridia bacterium]
MNEFIKLKNEQDYLDFKARTNDLHDGYIISADYRHPMIEEDGDRITVSMPDLILKILVTSMKGHPIVELKFSGVMDIRLAGAFSDIVCFSMKWDAVKPPRYPNPYVPWTNEFEFDWENYSMETNRIIAVTAEWGFVE